MSIYTSNKDYLVILAGSPRGGEETWSTLYKHVLAPLDADLAICCSDLWKQNNTLFKKAKYKWIFKEYSNYEDYYSKRFKGSWKEYFITGKDTGLYSSGMVQFAKKDIIREKYLHILKRYKYIVYTRFDQFYIQDHPKLLKNEILIPEGEDYKGLCDRHAAFPSEYAEKFLNICSYIDSSEALAERAHFNNSESTFLNHLKKENLLQLVRRNKRGQFTVNLKGEHTNWRTSIYRLYLYKNLMIKYPDEFITSVSNKLRIDSYYLFKKPKIVANYYYLATRRIIGKVKKGLIQTGT